LKNYDAIIKIEGGKIAKQSSSDQIINILEGSS